MIAPRRIAFAAAAALWAAAVLFFAVTADTAPTPSGTVNEASGDGPDIDLYRAVIARVRGGENYYAVLADELPRRDFAAAGTFNYRVPTYAVALAVLGERGGQIVLALVGIAGTVLVAVSLARHHGVLEAFTFALLQLGVLASSASSAGVYFAEAWAGELLLLSLGLYGADRPKAAAAAGLVALLFRELAAPYVVIAALLAAKDRRRGELIVWAVGLAAYAGLFAWHAATVQQFKPPNAQTGPGWLAFGGLPFVLTTCRMNAFFAAAPGWLVGLFLTAAGIGAFRGGSRLAVLAGAASAVYIAAFCIAGQPFNYYWGAVVGPVLPACAALAPATTRMVACGLRPTAPTPS